MLNTSICVFTAICEEDSRWIDSYLTEMRRLQLPYAIHFDHCSQETKDRLSRPPCVATTTNDRPLAPFDERHKQGIFDQVCRLNYDWAMAWDIDEVFEKDAPKKLVLNHHYKFINCKWINLWGDEQHVRVDGPFYLKPRAKFYNLRTHRWTFRDPVINGPYSTPMEGEIGDIDLVCLHKGLMTKELRELHKARWDRVYGQATGRNPYKIWDHALDETNYPPQVERHDWL